MFLLLSSFNLYYEWIKTCLMKRDGQELPAEKGRSLRIHSSPNTIFSQEQRRGWRRRGDEEEKEEEADLSLVTPPPPGCKLSSSLNSYDVSLRHVYSYITSCSWTNDELSLGHYIIIFKSSWDWISHCFYESCYDKHVINTWWTRDEYVMNTWWIRDKHVINMWWTRDEHVMNTWWIRDEYVINMW